MIADKMRAQQRANAERPPLAWAYPQPVNEPKLVEAVGRSGEDPNALRPWLTHHELHQAADVMMGILLFRMRRKPEALDRFDEVLAEPAVPCSERFFERYPLPVPFNVAGVDVTIPVKPQRRGNLCSGDVPNERRLRPSHAGSSTSRAE